MAHTATKTSNAIGHDITVLDGDEKTTIKIRLDDKCRNGHEDFSLTADIYEKSKNGRWVDVGGGCCHDHILKLRPDLAPFAALHLSTFEGVPMYAAGNALYWFAGFNGGLGKEHHGGNGSGGKTPAECRRIFAEHIRATPAQVDAIVAAAPRTEAELQAILEDMGFPQQWKREARAAIVTLEELSGHKFKSEATRGRWKPLSTEERAEIATRKAEGYYDADKVTARDAEKAEADKAARIASIRADLSKSIDKKERDAQVRIYMVERYWPNMRNFIYYDHLNEIAVNWTTTEALITREDFDRIAAELDPEALPAGITMKWQERPKY